jgi:hypothetical protein
MKPDTRFLNLPKHFWANVRTIGQGVGYTVRGKGIVRVPSMDEIRKAYAKIGLEVSHLVRNNGRLTRLGQTLLDYFAYRATHLNEFVEPQLMDVGRAGKLFRSLRAKLKPGCPLPMNKQKKAKKSHAFFTCIINMLIEANARGLSVDYDPHELTTVTRDSAPLRTLARRVDGAFTSPVNPVAIWEIKEYYYTTTFGSRVADGVYESLLDGMELADLANDEGIDVRHYLMVDAHYTWWDCGKSYLCRLLDMLHMGYVDEILFGYEVVERLPTLVKEWVDIVVARNRGRKP